MSSPRSWTLAMLLLAASCTRASSTAAPVAPPTFRPPGTGTGAAVASVLMHEGMPSVLAAGQTMAVSENLEIQEGDTLRVPAKSWLVLRLLGNGYVVKVDEDLELPVRDLALLKAPPAPQTLEQQLQQLADSREIGADRVTAYQNRRVAGSSSPRGKLAEESTGAARKVPLQRPAAATPAPVAAPVPAAEEAALPTADRDLPAKPSAAPGGGGGSPAPSPDAMKGVAAEVEIGAAAKSAEKAELRAPPAPGPSWEVVRGGYATTGEGALPAELAKALEGAKACIQAAWSAKGIATAGGADRLLLRVEGGRVVKVKLASGLPVAGCAAAGALVGKAAGFEGEGWIRIKFALE